MAFYIVVDWLCYALEHTNTSDFVGSCFFLHWPLSDVRISK